jgi:acyl-CoA hydrolase
MEIKTKKMNESRCIKMRNVFPTDTNYHNTLFGGELMKTIDDLASLAARKHSRLSVVTASMDSVDFLQPINPGDCVYVEAFCTYTGTSSMEIFCKVIAESIETWARRIAATSFLTFIAFDKQGKPTAVPKVIPESDEEIRLYDTGAERAERRKERRKNSQQWADTLSTNIYWE